MRLRVRARVKGRDRAMVRVSVSSIIFVVFDVGQWLHHWNSVLQNSILRNSDLEPKLLTSWTSFCHWTITTTAQNSKQYCSKFHLKVQYFFKHTFFSNKSLTYFSQVELLHCIPETVQNHLSKFLQPSDVRLSIMHASPAARVPDNTILTHFTFIRCT